jgi:hypothetical protein
MLVSNPLESCKKFTRVRGPKVLHSVQKDEKPHNSYSFKLLYSLFSKTFLKLFQWINIEFSNCWYPY